VARRTLEGGQVGCAITILNTSFCKDKTSSGEGGWIGVDAGTSSVWQAVDWPSAIRPGDDLHASSNSVRSSIQWSRSGDKD